MGKDQRKLSSYVKNAGLSKGYYLHVFAGGVGFLGVLVVYAAKLLRDVNLSVSGLGDLALAAAIQDRLFLVAALFFMSFLAFIASTVFYMIVVGQRVGGPAVGLTNYIRDLQNGKYDPPRPLRKNDELVEIHAELSRLAEILRSKSK